MNNPASEALPLFPVALFGIGLLAFVLLSLAVQLLAVVFAVVVHIYLIRSQDRHPKGQLPETAQQNPERIGLQID